MWLRIRRLLLPLQPFFVLLLRWFLSLSLWDWLLPDGNNDDDSERRCPELIIDGSNGPIRLQFRTSKSGAICRLELHDENEAIWDFQKELLPIWQRHFSTITIYFDGHAFPQHRQGQDEQQLWFSRGGWWRRQRSYSRVVLTQSEEADHAIVRHVAGHTLVVESIIQADSESEPTNNLAILRIVRTDQGPGKYRRWCKEQGLVPPYSVACWYPQLVEPLQPSLPSSLADVQNVTACEAVVVTDDIFLRQRVIGHAAVMSFAQLIRLGPATNRLKAA